MTDEFIACDSCGKLITDFDNDLFHLTANVDGVINPHTHVCGKCYNALNVSIPIIKTDVLRVWVAVAKTEDRDTYIYTFDYQPEFEDVIQLVYHTERRKPFQPTLKWYEETTDVYIVHREVRTKGN